jgi:hypothetical protein
MSSTLSPNIVKSTLMREFRIGQKRTSLELIYQYLETNFDEVSSLEA